MFKDKKSKAIWIVCLVLIVALIVGELVSLVLPDNGFLDKICTLFCMCACIYGLIYVYSGYKKNAAENYKLFMLLYALFCMASTINVYTKGDEIVNLISIIISAICSLIVLVLYFVKDLGKETSTMLSVSVLVMFVVGAVLTYGGMSKTIPTLVVSVQGVVLSFMACLFVNAKYKDKEARGKR